MRLLFFGGRRSTWRDPEGLAIEPLTAEEFRERIRTLEALQDALEDIRVAAIDHVEDQDDASRRRFELAYHAAYWRAYAFGHPEIRSKTLYAVHQSARVLNPLEAAGADGSPPGLVDEITAAVAAAQSVIGQRFRALLYDADAEE